MDKKQWMKRISSRSDFTCCLVHLTKPNNKMSSLEVLVKILKEKTLKGSTKGYICGDAPVVCFQDVPLQSISENILFEQRLRSNDKKQPVRYEPTGLRFSKPYIYSAGGRPVFYEDTDTAKMILPKEEYWRIVRFDLSKDESYIDWTNEREWRINGDLNFEYNEVEILLSQEYSLSKFINSCEKNELKHIVKEVKGITTLKSIVL